MKRKKKERAPRSKTHWCVDGKHNKCGEKVSEIKSGATDISALKKENFDYFPCHCHCHYNK